MTVYYQCIIEGAEASQRRTLIVKAPKAASQAAIADTVNTSLQGNTLPQTVELQWKGETLEAIPRGCQAKEGLAPDAKLASISPLFEGELPAIKNTIGCVHHRLYKKNRTQYTLCNGLLWILLCPKALWDWINTSSDQLATQQLHKYLETLEPKNFDAFCSYIKKQKKALERCTNRAEYEQQIQLFDQMIEYIRAIKAGDDLKALLKERLDTESPLAIPGGYYDEQSQFIPCIYWIEREDEGFYNVAIHQLFSQEPRKIMFQRVQKEPLCTTLAALLAPIKGKGADTPLRLQPQQLKVFHEAIMGQKHVKKPDADLCAESPWEYLAQQAPNGKKIWAEVYSTIQDSSNQTPDPEICARRGRNVNRYRTADTSDPNQKNQLINALREYRLAAHPAGVHQFVDQMMKILREIPASAKTVLSSCFNESDDRWLEGSGVTAEHNKEQLVATLGHFKKGEWTYIPGMHFEPLTSAYIPCIYLIQLYEPEGQPPGQKPLFSLTLHQLYADGPKKTALKPATAEEIANLLIACSSYHPLGEVATQNPIEYIQHSESLKIQESFSLQDSTAPKAFPLPAWEQLKQHTAEHLQQEAIEETGLGSELIDVLNPPTACAAELLAQTLTHLQRLQQTSRSRSATQMIDRLAAQLQERWERQFDLSLSLPSIGEAISAQEPIISITHAPKAMQGTAIDEISSAIALQRRDVERKLSAYYGGRGNPPFQECLALANQHIDTGNYTAGRELALALLSSFPPLPLPGKAPHLFWTQQRSRQEWEEIGEVISQATTLAWETGIRLEKREMDAETLYAFVLSRAVLVHIARTRNRATRDMLQRELDTKLARAPRPSEIFNKLIQAKTQLHDWGADGKDSLWLKFNSEESLLEILVDCAQPIGISREEFLSLIFDQFQTDTAQFIQVLTQDPFLRPSGELGEKLDAVLTYLAPPKNASPSTPEAPLVERGRRIHTAPIIRLDAWIDAPRQGKNRITSSNTVAQNPWDCMRAPEFRRSYGNGTTYHANADYVFLCLLYKTTEMFDRRPNENLSLRRLWQEIEVKPDNFLPGDIVRLRRHTMMFQSLLQPECSMALSFNNLFGALSWWSQLQEEAYQACGGDLDQKNAYTLQIAYKQLSERLKRMQGRLKLSVETYVASDEDVIAIQSTKSRETALYLPWGLGLPETIATSLDAHPNGFRGESQAGDIPRHWLQGGIGPGGDNVLLNPPGTDGEALVHITAPSSAIPYGNQTYPSEVARMKHCLETSEDWMKEYLMTSLKVSVSEGGRVAEIQGSAVREACLIMATKPEMLLDPQVRGRLDLLFRERGQVESFLLHYPLMGQWLPQLLDEQIQKLIGQRHLAAALFLIRLSSYLKQKGYDTKGYDLSYMRELEKLHAQYPYFVRLAIAEALREQYKGADADRFIEQLPPKILADLIHLKSQLEEGIDPIGLATLEQDTKEWLQRQIYPALLAHLQQNKQKRTETLNLFSKNASEGEWTLDGENLYRKGNIVVNLETGAVEGTGVQVTLPKMATQIPKTILRAIPRMESWFGSSIQAERSLGPNRSKHYAFTHQGISYQINAERGNLPILQRAHEGKWCTYIPEFEGIGQIEQWGKEFGLWFDEEEKTYYIFMPTGTLSFSLQGEALAWNGNKVNERGEGAIFPSHLHHQLVSENEQELYLLDRGITLHRDGEGWRNAEGETVVFDASEAPIAAQTLHTLLGRKTALHFVDAKKQMHRFLIWPHVIRGEQASLPSSLMEAQNIPPLEAHVDAQGNIQTSAAGYLYLAYRAMTKGKLKDSQHYLQKAAAEPVRNAEEEKAFVFLSAFLLQQAMSTAHDKNRLFYLKALFAIACIKQKKTGSPREENLPWQKSLERARELSRLYRNFLAQTKLPNETLTPEERAYYNQVSIEALADLLSPVLPKRITYALPPVSSEELDDNLYRYLAYYLPTEAPSPPDSPPPLTSEWVLHSFIDCIQKAHRGELHSKNIAFLFAEIHDLDPERKQAAYIAQRLIIQYILGLEEQEEKEPLPPWNIQAMAQARRQVSSKPFTLGFWSVLSALWKGDFTINDQNAVSVISHLQKWIPKLPFAQVGAGKELKYLTPRGLVSAKEIEQEERPFLNVKQALADFDRICTELQLNPLERTIFEVALKECAKETEEEIPLEIFLDQIRAESGISPIEMRQEEIAYQQILALEARIAQQEAHSLQDVEGIGKLPEKIEMAPYFEAQDAGRETLLTQTIPDQIHTYFQESHDLSEPEKMEFALMREGVKSARSRIAQELVYQRLFKQNAQQVLSRTIERQRREASADYTALRNKLLQRAKRLDLPELQEIWQNPHLRAEEEALEWLLDLYQRSDILGEETNRLIQEYLLHGTYLQQLARAAEILEILHNLDARSEEYRVQSYELCDILGRRLDPHRYEEMKNDSLRRKYLVLEYRLNIILRKGQQDTIAEICQNPQSYHSLRMGEGKTAYIMPAIAAMLAQQGKLPFIVVPQELYSLNQESFDAMTRRVFGRYARTLEINPARMHMPSYCAELYLHLLKGHKEGCYFVLTINQLTSLTNLIEDLREKRRTGLQQLEQQAEQRGITLEQFLNTDRGAELLLQLQQWESSLFYLRRIECLLDAKREGDGPVTVDSVFFVDEVDALLHITKEHNRAIGTKIPFHPAITAVAQELFSRLIEDPALERLKIALIEGHKIPASQQTDHVKALARAVLSRWNLTQVIQEGEEEALIDYLVGESVPSARLALRNWDNTEIQQKIGALKHLLSATFKTLFDSEAPLHYKFADDLGYLIVPATSGKSQKGDRYSEECEIIAFQYLGYLQANLCQAQGGATQDIFKQAIEELEFIDPEVCRSMRTAHARLYPKDSSHASIEAIDLARMLLEKPQETAHFRLAILHHMFRKGLFNRYREQITLPVQSVLTNRAVGGVTGTLNAYALPKTSRAAVSSRSVEAETLIKMSAHLPEGLNTETRLLPENALAWSAGLIAEHQCAAIVDEGGYLTRGRSIAEAVTTIFKQHKPNKAIVYPDEYTDPKTNQRRTAIFIKESLEAPARMISEAELKKLQTRYVIIFSPEYTRGTDLPILPGEVHYFPAKTTNLQSMGQSIWRARGTGVQHRPIVHLASNGREKEAMTLGAYLVEVTRASVAQQLPFNTAAQQRKIQEIAYGGVRQILNHSDAHQEFTQIHGDQETIGELLGHMYLENTFHHIFRDYKIRSKEAQLAIDYEKSNSQKTENLLIAAYKKEERKLREKQAALIQFAQDRIQDETIVNGVFSPSLEEADAFHRGLRAKEQQILVEASQQLHRAVEPALADYAPALRHETTYREILSHAADKALEEEPRHQRIVLQQEISAGLLAHIPNTPLRDDLRPKMKEALQTKQSELGQAIQTIERARNGAPMPEEEAMVKQAAQALYRAATAQLGNGAALAPAAWQEEETYENIVRKMLQAQDREPADILIEELLQEVPWVMRFPLQLALERAFGETERQQLRQNITMLRSFRKQVEDAVIQRSADAFYQAVNRQVDKDLLPQEFQNREIYTQIVQDAVEETLRGKEQPNGQRFGHALTEQWLARTPQAATLRSLAGPKIEEAVTERKSEMDALLQAILTLRQRQQDVPIPQRRILNRTVEVHRHLNTLVDRLENERRLFEENYAASHAPFLPKEQKSADSANAHEQVQEQEQQQQQQQQTTAARTANPPFRGGKNDAFKTWDPQFLANPQEHPAEFIRADGQGGVFFSKEAREIERLMPSLAGEPIWKYVINERGHVIVLSKNDFDQVIQPDIKNQKGHVPYCVIAPTRNSDLSAPGAFVPIGGNFEVMDCLSEEKYLYLQRRLGFCS